MSMRFLRPNFCNTITLITVDAANTLTVDRLIDHNTKTRWQSIGYTGATSTTIKYSFTTDQNISAIFIQNHNLKAFSIYYNGTTTNQFTPNISETTNSATSSLFFVNTTAVANIILKIDEAMTGAERLVGEFYAGNLWLDLERNPTAADYTPNIYRKQVRHEMADGGTVLYNIDEKYRAKLKWKYVSETFKNDLLSIYNTGTSFYFVPFPTTTSWDGLAYEVAWPGAFDFKHSDNNKSAGFSGQLSLEEVP